MKFKLSLLFCIIIAVIAGAFLGDLCAAASVPYITWLGHGLSFGFDTISVNLHVMQLDFGLHMDINVMQILLVLIAIVVAPKLAAAIKTG